MKGQALISPLWWPIIGPEGITWGTVRGGLVWILGKVLHPEGSWALKQAPQGSGHSTKPDRVEEELGQCGQAHGVTLGAVLSGTRSGLCVNPFKLRILCDCMNVIDCGSAFSDAVVMQVMSKQTYMLKLKRFVCIRIICLVTYSNRFFFYHLAATTALESSQPQVSSQLCVWILLSFTSGGGGRATFPAANLLCLFFSSSLQDCCWLLDSWNCDSHCPIQKTGIYSDCKLRKNHHWSILQKYQFKGSGRKSFVISFASKAGFLEALYIRVILNALLSFLSPFGEG